jgi:hypothetical protein
MLAFLVYAAETGNKTSFYVVAGIFTVWAVALGGIGTARPAFISGAAQGRLVMAGSVILAAATIAMAIATSS